MLKSVCLDYTKNVSSVKEKTHKSQRQLQENFDKHHIISLGNHKSSTQPAQWHRILKRKLMDEGTYGSATMRIQTYSVKHILHIHLIEIVC